MTIRTFNQKMSEHRDCPKSDVQTEPSGEHFKKRGYTVAHLKGQVWEKVKNRDPFVLKSRDRLLFKYRMLITYYVMLFVV